jgi:hypothetical protein
MTKRAKTKHVSKAAAAAKHVRANGEPKRTKVSVALAPRDLAWAAGEAAERGVSLSQVFQEALQGFERKTKLVKLLEVVGGDADITDEDLKRVDVEWRAVGFCP